MGPMRVSCFALFFSSVFHLCCRCLSLYLSSSFASLLSLSSSSSLSFLVSLSVVSCELRLSPCRLRKRNSYRFAWKFLARTVTGSFDTEQQ